MDPFLQGIIVGKPTSFTHLYIYIYRYIYLRNKELRNLPELKVWQRPIGVKILVKFLASHSSPLHEHVFIISLIWWPPFSYTYFMLRLPNSFQFTTLRFMLVLNENHKACSNTFSALCSFTKDFLSMLKWQMVTAGNSGDFSYFRVIFVTVVFLQEQRRLKYKERCSHEEEYSPYYTSKLRLAVKHVLQAMKSWVSEEVPPFSIYSSGPNSLFFRQKAFLGSPFSHVYFLQYLHIQPRFLWQKGSLGRSICSRI